MSLFSRFIGRVGGGANKRIPGLQTGLSGSYPASAATTVNEDTALCLSGFWACVRLIAESVGSMRVRFYRKNADGTRTEIFDHPLGVLLNGKVNRYQTRPEFFETLTMNLCMHGNGFALKQTNSKGTIIGLMPMMSPQMEVVLTTVGDIAYRYNDGQNTQRDFTSDKIWHNKLMGNGVIGLSPLSYARNSIGIGLAAENTAGKIYRNGGKPAAALSLPPEMEALTAEQRKQLKQNFNDIASGDGEDNLFVLELGMKYTQVSMSPQDIELLSSRSFQLKDVARFMGVPSVLINDMDATTVWGSGISEIIEGFYKFGLRPYLERYEASIVHNLLPPEERNKIEVEFDFNDLLRADMEKRFRTFKEAILGGFMAPNEARSKEGWVPKDGGDDLFMQQQMVPVNQLATISRSNNNSLPKTE